MSIYDRFRLPNNNFPTDKRIEDYVPPTEWPQPDPPSDPAEPPESARGTTRGLNAASGRGEQHPR